LAGNSVCNPTGSILSLNHRSLVRLAWSPIFTHLSNYS